MTTHGSAGRRSGERRQGAVGEETEGHHGGVGDLFLAPGEGETH
jgi:hypothetical protein